MVVRKGNYREATYSWRFMSHLEKHQSAMAVGSKEGHKQQFDRLLSAFAEAAVSSVPLPHRGLVIGMIVLVDAPRLGWLSPNLNSNVAGAETNPDLGTF